MFEAYLVRGLKAGLVAGVVLGLFVALLANPMIAAAEGLTSGHGGHSHADGNHHAAGSGHGDTSGVLGVVSVPLIGVVGSVFWALLLGVVTFGFAFYFLEPAIPGAGATKRAVAAAAGFVTVSGAPWLALPPQPPGVQQALPVDTRLAIYAGMMVAGLTACLLAGYAYDRLRDAGRVRALAAAAAPFALLVGLAVAVPANTTTQSLPPAFVDAFRAQVLFGQLLVWTLLAGAHAWLSGADDAAASTGHVGTTPSDSRPTSD